MRQCRRSIFATACGGRSPSERQVASFFGAFYFPRHCKFGWKHGRSPHLLHPPLLDELGMDSAARWYVEGFSKRSGIEVRVHPGEIVELPREVELALFPVFQEALTNVHRHANARSVDSQNSCEGGTLF